MSEKVAAVADMQQFISDHLKEDISPADVAEALEEV